MSDLRGKARALVIAALAAGIAPAPEVLPSAWAEENIKVPDGPRAGTKWDASLTPYLIEPLDRLAATDPTTKVAVRKSAQVGYTMVAQAWLGYVVDVAPARTMMVLPTIAVAQDFNREKLTPTIEASPVLKTKVRRQVTRSSEGSTALNKRFAGGSIVITGANSSADLRSKTVRFALCDEIDEWPADLDGQGDPLAMVEARQIAFTATGDWKRLLGSTPTMAGASRIDAAFEAGDQRYWHVDCPHCGETQVLRFFPGADGKGGLRFETSYPYQAWYACSAGGCVIEEHEKRAMVSAGRWLATQPGPGRYPSYHIDALMSLLTTWDEMASAFLASKDDPAKFKAFVNLWLGQAWEERGEAPEWERLFARRDDYAARIIPPGGLVFTAGADVQQDGIYYEIVAWGRGQESWSIDAGFLAGETADPSSGAWAALSEVYDRRYPDAYGNTWPVDAFAVDSGYNPQQVYLWTSARPSARAIKGRDGWHLAAISTAPSKVDIDWAGKRRRRGAQLWTVGTWGLKSTLYANLRKPGRRDGAELDPPGYCHFTDRVHDERFFRQLTAEFLKARETKGRTVREWYAAGANHWHDCRIYAMAMSAHLGVDKLTADDWARLARQRGEPPEGPQGDLLARTNAVRQVQAEPARPAGEAPRRSRRVLSRGV